MNEQEDILLEQFVNLPQLKQVLTDKDELVKSIEELASKAWTTSVNMVVFYENCLCIYVYFK